MLNHAQPLDLMFQALADPSRRIMVERLSRGPPVTLGIGEPFTMTLAVAAMFAFLLGMPGILFQIYAFIIPAFTREERRAAIPLLSLIPFLFCAGVAFGYFLVLPAAVHFLTNFDSSLYDIQIRASYYYSFVTMVVLGMGLVFELPMFILALDSIVSPHADTLRRNRLMQRARLSSDIVPPGQTATANSSLPTIAGRRCSSTRPAASSSSNTSAWRSGSGLPGFGVGSSATRPLRSATQPNCSGQTTQAGSARLHRVAPKSICAWV